MNPLAERLLVTMDRKHHWAYPSLTRPGLTREQLLTHFRHEYATYVRDFPVLLARALGQVPPIESLRASLAENLYEEQTGRLSGTAPHPELFLRMMEGLGFTRADFSAAHEDRALAPEARDYRDWLRQRAAGEPWQAAVALLTIFVEGSVNERAELAGTFVRSRGPEVVLRHPLVVHYGCPPAAMELARAHAAVEGAHRGDAWRFLDEVPASGPLADVVARTCEEALERWLTYRDAVARQMGLVRKAA
jgi:pyrroloquinoline-quinone synthase